MNKKSTRNRRKIINDPVYGFIQIPSDNIFEIIEHPYFQRLRRIRQLGLTFYVYPGANHNRFQHALGAAHLMATALEVIQRKGAEVTNQEIEAAIEAILLHDIGHGPFSHTLENSLVPLVDHEDLSRLYLKHLNNQFGGILETAIQIFNDKYPKPYFHELVSSQLDMDRLDYLRRDSFFTGVSEGTIGSDRIIKMLRVIDNQLVVEMKGVYSIEKFLISRRLMYWQVYLHKTVIAAEQMLIKTLLRARYLAHNGEYLFATPALSDFLYPGPLTDRPLENEELLLETFSKLDDSDIFSALKTWSDHKDKVLSFLAQGLINRKLLAIQIQKNRFDASTIENVKSQVRKMMNLSNEEVDYLVFTEVVSNYAYHEEEKEIQFVDNQDQLHQLSDTSEIVNIPLLGQADAKYYLCSPKENLC